MAEKIKDKLYSADLISSPEAVLRPLNGGVSSDIYLVEDGENKFVVKQALEELKVEAKWEADTSRNNYEQLYLKYVGDFLPQAVPQILYSSEVDAFFTMEFLNEGFDNWKSKLLSGDFQVNDLMRSIEIMAKIHQYSYKDEEAKALFDSDKNFYELRIDPYFSPLAEKYPELKPTIEQYSQRLANCHEALVHGDFSPKNILLNDERVVVLDCEVAWYGDPSFDPAFLFTHFLLKALHLKNEEMAQILPKAIDLYQEITQNNIDERLCELVPMLLLARVDGKSPVEYLTDNEKSLIVEQALAMLREKPRSFEQISKNWRVK